MPSDVGSWAPSPSNYMTCYIYNLLTNEKIVFQTLPDDVSESYSGEWQSTDVMGRSAPYQAFTGNPARTVDYSVTLNRDILGTDFEKTVDKCKRLVYPRYANDSIVVPPYCYVRFGGMITMYAIVESVSVSWNGTIIADEDTDPNSNYFSQAEISFSFVELRVSGQGLPIATNLKTRVVDF